MISLFFGLPGSGKTTIMASLAHKWSKRKRYDNIYCNVRLSIPGVTYIDNDCIGKYDLSNCLLLIDEATLFADSRSYKEFSKDKIQYFLMHRHYRCDVYLFTQQWDGVDRKIRVITDRVYYIYKPILTGFWWSKYYRIPYGIIIPNPKKDQQKLGEIIQGYCKPSFLVRLLAPKIFRPRYYKYFDSFETVPLPALPDKYQAFPKVLTNKQIRAAEKRAAAVNLKSCAGAAAPAHEGAGASPQNYPAQADGTVMQAQPVSQASPPTNPLSLIDRA